MLNIFIFFLIVISSFASDKIPVLPSTDTEIKWDTLPSIRNGPLLTSFCKKINQAFLDFGWGESQCQKIKWNHIRNSVKGDPLVWTVFGKEKDPTTTTLILCGVHGDEITPNKFCFDIIYHVLRYSAIYSNQLIIVAPFVNPDGFFSAQKTRTNFNSVDVNRNFPTKDWPRRALSLWKTKYKKDKRRYPGERPLSEPEVVFQVNLIKRYKPNKIVSVHAPLTLIDYDGPLGEEGESNNLLLQMSQSANGYAVKDYPYFPGSLGNFAGNELGIPTFTLELPSSDNRKHSEYWQLFKNAIHTAFFRDLRSSKVEVTKK